MTERLSRIIIDESRELTTIHDLCSDIWTHVFEYFEAMELFTIFPSITSAADQVLHNDFYGACFRAFTLTGPSTEIPAWTHMNRIVSMTLYETTSIEVLAHCSELRSLKLIGEINWITSAIKTISHTSTKLSQLTIVTSVVTSLSKTLLPILSVPSLRRLEIHLDEIVENTELDLFVASSNSIEQLIFDSGTTIHWNEFFKATANCISVRLLSISLIDENPLPINSFVFHNLRTLCLRLLEAPFISIIQLLARTKNLVKLKLTGLACEDAFVVNPRWTDLFEYSPTLSQVFVDLSLEQANESFDCEEIRTSLLIFNLSLLYDGDDADYHSYSGVSKRWWYLRGVISRKKTSLQSFEDQAN